MAQQMVARVTCPTCGRQFQAPIQQVLDVGEDPSAKTQVLNGVVNVAKCPHCDTQGALNVPFIYHDPDKELALVHMPMESGGDNQERQRVIGRLTSAVMDRLPSDQRKAYLLQPQVFLTRENMIKEILKADGVTEEMIEEQREKGELLQRMLSATSDEALEAMIEANEDSIDAPFFRLLNRNLEMAQMMGQEGDTQPLQALREKLLDLTSEGRAIRARTEMLEALREEPNRDKLLQLLIEAPDAQTRELLVASGRSMMDYLFFQDLTSRIDDASDEDERERLTALRREILDIRDRLDEEARELYRARAELLRDLLMSDDPEDLARRRVSEIDRVFLNVLAANLDKAQEEGAEESVRSLQAIQDLVLTLMEETMPPRMRLFNRLVNAEDEAEIEQLLEGNRDMVTEPMMQFIEETEAQTREDGDLDSAEQMSMILEKMRGMMAEEMLETA